MIYAVYNNKIYVANVRESKVRLKTRAFESGFSELVDLAGNIHKNIFIKEIDMDHVDFVYEVEYRVLYKDHEYRCLKVSRENVETNNITIYTNDSELGKKYEFVQVDKFIFDKDVSLDEIDALIEIKKPLSTFNHLKEERTKVEKQDIKRFLANIIE